ncbi:MAG TPA: acyl-CoA dehydrogenase family protein, partial [Chryseosolibacter sp.]|nr:acyl-CoA dehydrogenase family protein [Chryseosolibacter sp.]
MYSMSHHPSIVLAKDIVEDIRQVSAEAERLGDLHPLQLKHIYEQGWFKMFIPQSYGGLGWSLPRALEAEEALSWADASTAWVVTLCAGAGWFTGFLSPSLVRELVGHEHVCFAGSGAATGIADERSDGFHIDGHWKYASGSLHATVFTANCVLHSHGQPRYNDDGTPIVRPFVFHRNEISLYRHWNGMGMIATGSHSFAVKNLIVHPERCFSIEPEHAIVDAPVFRYPFLQLAETTLSVNLSGMAMRFLELCDRQL